MKLKKIYSTALAIAIMFVFVSEVCCDEKGAPGGPENQFKLLDRQKVLSMARKVNRADFPDADDVLVDDYEKIIYQADGTSETWDEAYEKILTEKGRRASQSISLYYTLPYSKSKVILLEIIKPGGKSIKIDVKKNSREMIDRSQMKDNIYNPKCKILKVNVPGIEPGDLLHYITYRKVTKARVPNTWSDYKVFEHTSPILHYLFEIDGPKSLPLKKIELKDELPGKVIFNQDTKGDRKLYRWEISGVRRIFEEPNMPEYYTVTQRLLVSTIPDWKEISKWYWNLCLPHLEKTTPEMEKTVVELTKNAKNDEEKISAIFKYVAEKIRYMGLTIEKVSPGYEPHDVNITFEKKYGVCRDKGVLLVAMLRMAGLKAFPVLFNNGPKKDQDVPQPYFNHAIACVENDDGTYQLMDPTDETSKELFPSYLCNKSYLVARPEGETIKVSQIVPAEKNIMRIETKGELDAEKTLHAESSLSFGGVNDGYYRGYFARITPKDRKRFFEGIIKRAVSGATLDDLRIEPENLSDKSKVLTVTIKYHCLNYPIQAEGLDMLPQLYLGKYFGAVNWILGRSSLEKRKYPLETEIACGVEEKFTLSYGDNLGKVVFVPKSKEIELETLNWRQKLSIENKSLTGSSEFIVKVVEFSPKQYLSLKSALRDIEYKNRQKVFFTRADNFVDIKAIKTAFPNADIVVLNEELDISIIDEHSYKSSKRVKKKILTYAGKKDNSELEISYNPIWEEVSITDVKVTGENGKIRRIDEKELNVMDAAWVGSAPRYPPGKTLVASLPGVEIGSIIEYKVHKTVKDRPFVSLKEYFQYQEPLKRKIVKISYPKGFQNFQHKLIHAEHIEFQRKDSKNEKILIFKNDRQQPVLSENALPSWWTFTPTLLVSTGNWVDYTKNLNSIFEKASERSLYVTKVARQICTGVKNPKLKLKIIRDYVAQRNRTAGPNFLELPFSAITPADKTMTDGYGNRADQAILLFAMARAVDFKPEFVLASHYPSLKILTQDLISYPLLSMFSWPLVRIPFAGDFIYLNDSSQYAKLGVTAHAGYQSLVLSNGKIEKVEVPKGDELENKIVIDFDIRINSKGNCELKKSKRFYGTSYSSFHRKFAEMTPEIRRRYHEKLVSGISQAALAKGKLTAKFSQYPGLEEFSVKIDKYAVREGKYLYFKLPSNILRNVFAIRSNKRLNPFYHSSKKNIVVTQKLSLPENMLDYKLLPKEYEYQLGNGNIRILNKIDKKKCLEDNVGQILTIKQELRSKPFIFPAAFYPGLVEIQQKLLNPAQDMVIVTIEAEKR